MLFFFAPREAFAVSAAAALLQALVLIRSLLDVFVEDCASIDADPYADLQQGDPERALLHLLALGGEEGLAKLIVLCLLYSGSVKDYRVGPCRFAFFGSFVLAVL